MYYFNTLKLYILQKKKVNFKSVPQSNEHSFKGALEIFLVRCVDDKRASVSGGRQSCFSRPGVWCRASTPCCSKFELSTPHLQVLSMYLRGPP